MLTKAKPLSKRGDTIVEVMLVLAILGFAISISYATATRSLVDARRAQENAQASSLLQAQAEALRSMVDIDGANTIFRTTPPNPFCVDDGAPVYVIRAVGHAACTKKSLYDISITYTAADSTFSMQVTWEDVRGEGDNSVYLKYRLYKPVVTP